MKLQALKVASRCIGIGMLILVVICMFVEDLHKPLTQIIMSFAVLVGIVYLLKSVEFGRRQEAEWHRRAAAHYGGLPYGEEQADAHQRDAKWSTAIATITGYSAIAIVGVVLLIANLVIHRR